MKSLFGETTEIERSAVFSECRRYRYTLTRVWDWDSLVVNFIGLNPSVANENDDDATIRRCMGFARSWGYGGIVMTNLFAWCATDPKEMKAAAEPIGKLNDSYLIRPVPEQYLADPVACWGNHGIHLGRDKAVMELLKRQQVHCLGRTKGGCPKHPVRLAKVTKLERFKIEG